jgi:hypothetical protein
MTLRRQTFTQTVLLSALPLLAGLAGSLDGAWAQEDRRPCLYRNVPAGCIPTRGLPKPMMGPVMDPDTPGVVPVSELPIVKGPQEWQPPDDFNKGTVTVDPVSPEEQGPAPTDPAPGTPP